MKKNLRIKLVFLFSLFLVLLSCRTDLTDYENKANEARQTYIAKQLSYNELKQQFPLVADKVSTLKKLTKSTGSNSKIYTDAVDEFTIDTEKSLYIEDEKGVKTYTFEVSTRESTPEILENLVLKDIGNNEFEAYIATYDKYAIENLTKLSLEEYKSHVTLIQLGNKKGSDIFGKYNANSCTLSYLADIMEVYVPGTLCGSELHHNYTQFLNGACTDDIKPTPGYYDSVFIYASENICNGGSTGNGTIATGPILGGSGGGTVQTPCTKLKNDLQKAKTIVAKTNIKNQNSTMIATIATDPNEKVFAFGKDANGVYQVSPIVTLGANGGNMDLSNLGFIPEGDVHNHNGINTPASPSPTDIYGFHSVHSSIPSYEIKIVNGSDGSQYALTITDQLAFDEFVQANSLAASVDVYNASTNPKGKNFWIKDSKLYVDFMNAATYFVNQDYNQNDAFVYGMAFVTKKYKIGVMISKKDSNGDFKPFEINRKSKQFDPENYDYEVTHPCGI